MRFQTRQVLELAEISSDTLRSWKRHLPPISAVDGRSGQYTPGQLVGICAIAAIVRAIGLPISRISPEAEVVFDTLERYTSDRRRNVSMVLTSTQLYFETDDTLVNEPVFVIVKLNPIWDKIQNSFLEPDPRDVTQAKLPFSDSTENQT